MWVLPADSFVSLWALTLPCDEWPYPWRTPIGRIAPMKAPELARMRRWVLLAAGLAIAMAVSGCGGESHLAISSTTIAPSSVAATTFDTTTTTEPATTTTATSGAPVLVLAGNGVAGVRFGQSQASAVNGLDRILDSPVKGPIDMAGNCNVDTAEQWSTLTAYFDKGAFVGYGTWAANGEAVPPGNFETAMGLRVGDSVMRAAQIYGSSFQTSLAQGGSWSVSTPQGKLIGYLSAEPNEAGPSPTILTIAAGSVGCPAVTP